MPTSSTSTIADELRRSFVTEAKHITVPAIAAFLLIVYLVAPSLPYWTWLTWLSSLVALQIIQVLTMKENGYARNVLSGVYLKLMAGFSLANGIGVSSILLFSNNFSEFTRLLLTLVMVVMAVAQSNLTLGYKQAFLPYSIPITGSLVTMWLILPSGQYYSVQTGNLLAVMIVIFMFSFFDFSKQLFTYYHSSYSEKKEISKLNIRLNSALSKAETANQSKTRFLASASHDLRQPIHTLSLLGAALSLQKLDKNTADIAAMIDHSIQGLNLQLNALLDISKLDSDLIKPNISPLCLNVLLDRLKAQFEVQAIDKGLDLKLSIAEETWVLSDAVMLEQIINNLLSNAVRYTDTGRVIIAVEIHPKIAQVSIRDSGIGIDEAKQEKIFEEFYQVGNEIRDRSEGLGLGLSIVARMSALIDIDVALKSTLGQGSLFSFELPLTTTPEHVKAKTTQQSEINFTELNILVVDNEVDVTASIKVLLTAVGYKISEAHTIDQALDSINTAQSKDRPFDILLVDLRLEEERDGLNLIELIKPLHPDLSPIIISGDSSAERIKQAKEAGIRYLQKPVHSNKLLSAIADIMTHKVQI